AIPDLANSIMVIMQALSLVFAIEVVDIFAQSHLTAALNFYYLEAFLIAVVIYMVIANPSDSALMITMMELARSGMAATMT
ncbi:hypothetical protein ACC687_39975, partial [Rhizobium ruizarguesonis]